jgi:hypothetical protein
MCENGASMKMVMSNLPELVNENQELLAQLILSTMWFNGFKVDGVEIKFHEGNDELVRPPF